ncbi:hypothetical protein, partial [Synechococcus sp. PCC 7335]|uniref:hypothetical protein n=1 Tax=Synechococcus sp. (strain ATCC 29403 / PCC 7335) TaxID=91464 RepID=UPI001D0CF277
MDLSRLANRPQPHTIRLFRPSLTYARRNRPIRLRTNPTHQPDHPRPANRRSLPQPPSPTPPTPAPPFAIWALDNDSHPYFAIFKSADEAFPGKPFGVGFAPKTWHYNKTAALTI